MEQLLRDLTFLYTFASIHDCINFEGAPVFKDLRQYLYWHRSCLIECMMAYELYLFDAIKGWKLIGILPERRKDPKRITKESVLKWGRMVLGESADAKSIFFEQVDIDHMAGHISYANTASKNH